MERTAVAMKIEHFDASKYGNGAQVAEEFKRQMTAKGAAVTVRHIRDAAPREMPVADLYVFNSPGRLGKPTWGMRRFLKKAKLPAAPKYVIVDAADYEWLSQYNLWLQSGYAIRNESGKKLYMPREIMQTGKGMLVDHANGRKRENRRSNLRVQPRGRQVLRRIRAETGQRLKGCDLGGAPEGRSWQMLCLGLILRHRAGPDARGVSP